MRRGFALLVALGLACGGGAPEPPPEPPHGIVVVVLDTARADGLSVYGNPRDTSPAIDGLAQRGVLFERAISNAPWTLPGFIGLYSGSYTSRRVFAKGKLEVSLVENLREAGYATAAVTEGGFTSAHFGLDRGFDRYTELEGVVRLQVAGDQVEQHGGGSTEATFDAAFDWLREKHQNPFFLLVHTYELHVPYERTTYSERLPAGSLSAPYDGRTLERVMSGELPVGPEEIAFVRALYDGGIRAADLQVGRLLALLEELGIADRTVVVLTSDHGETLGERGTHLLGLHGERVYDELLHIPLIIHDPRIRYPVSRVSAQVRLVDVMPTLLDLAGVEARVETDGRSLLPLMLGREAEDRLAFSDGDPISPEEVRRTTVQDGRYKLIANVAPRPPELPAAELYDLAEDPRERNDLGGQPGEARARLAPLLERHWLETGGIRHGRLELGEDLPEDLRRRLQALGYATP